MTSSTINAPLGQGPDKCSSTTHIAPRDYHQAITEAIRDHEVLQLEYQGNRRNIIPLVFGQLKNGHQAVLCYKIVPGEAGEAELFMRLYHLSKIRHLHRTGVEVPVRRKIDYYLTKHFARVYQKI